MDQKKAVDIEFCYTKSRSFYVREEWATKKNMYCTLYNFFPHPSLPVTLIPSQMCCYRYNLVPSAWLFFCNRQGFFSFFKKKNPVHHARRHPAVPTYPSSFCNFACI